MEIGKIVNNPVGTKIHNEVSRSTYPLVKTLPYNLVNDKTYFILVSLISDFCLRIKLGYKHGNR
jgi:hypothetical protein